MTEIHAVAWLDHRETYVRSRHRDFAKRIVGVETLDHPTDGQLLAHARTSFAAIDQLGGTRS